MKKIIFFLSFAILGNVASFAQTAKEAPSKYSVITNSILDNWFVQVGPDMSLQNPYGKNLREVFPNGKTFGVNEAFGRWCTPGLGLRARVNWENGIGLLENHHATWIAPFEHKGKNLDKGGYMSFVGDVQLNLHNIFIGYDEERIWNFNVYPRAGIVYNFGVKKGSPLIGAGIGNTFRINERYSIYLDAAYQMVSSGFTGVEADTGTGSNSNGYFDISVGIQINLGKSSFRKP